MRKRNLITFFLIMLRRNNLLRKKTHARYDLRIRAVMSEDKQSQPIRMSAVNNADRRRNFTNFNSQLLERIVEAKSG